MNDASTDSESAAVADSGAIDEAVLSLISAALLLEPPAAILVPALAAVAREDFRWAVAAEILEKHGVIGVAERTLDRARVPIPESFREVADRSRLRSRAAGVMLDHFLAAAAKNHLRVMLLKGASLAQDVYGGFDLRGMSDLDLLVHAEDLDVAWKVARQAGAAEPVDQMPEWWARQAHFHVKAAPRHPWLPEIELHWSLHPEQHLHLDGGASLWLRASEIRVNGHRAFDLWSVDRFLHLVTHLESHGIVLPRLPWPDFFRALAAARMPSVRLKWIADLFLVVRRMSASVLPEDVVTRAFEWNAQRSVLAVGDILLGAKDHLGASAAWLEEITLAIARTTSLPERDESRADWAETTPPMRGFGFRLGALRRALGFLWPETAYFRSRDGKTPVWAKVMWIARLLHLQFALFQLASLAVMTGVAFAVKAFGKKGRAARLAAPLAPELTLDLAMLERRRAGEAAARRANV